MMPNCEAATTTNKAEVETINDVHAIFLKSNRLPQYTSKMVSRRLLTPINAAFKLSTNVRLKAASSPACHLPAVK